MEVFYGLLQLLCLWAIVCTKTSNGQSECTSGFMSRDRVRDLSRVVGGSRRTRERQQRIIPMINFTCSGLINKWTVAAKWNGRGEHINFPQLEIWRIQSAGSNVYNRVGSTLVEETIENDNQTYEFVPSTPLQFQPGDILGIFNPDNPRLGIYYVDTIGPPNYHTTGEGTSPSTASFNISGNIDTQNDLPLITVDTSSSNGRSNCTNGFTSLDGILVGLGIRRLKNRDRQQRIIPHINFTCDGAITKWIVAGRWDDGRNHDWYPDLQIWRSAGTNMFTKVGNTTLRVEGGSDSLIYYEYNLTTPLNFQAGDVLGIFQPNRGRNRLRMYFLSVGPRNYYETLDNNVIVEPPTDMFALGTEFQNDFPLVAVEIREEAHPSVCTLPPWTGQCKAAILRYFYNSTSEQCEVFIYGGCMGNDNNFETQESCVEQCITPTSVTTLANTTTTVAGTTTTVAGTTTTVAGIATTVAGTTTTVAGTTTTVAGIATIVVGTTTTAAGTTTTIVDTTVVGTTAIAGNTTATNSTSSTSTVATATITSDHTSVSPLSTAAAATIGIALSGTVIFVVVLLLLVVFLLARKQSHSKQTPGNLYETPDAITTKENKAYRSNIQTQHIAMAANEAYGHGGGIPVVQNVAYKPAAVHILPVQNEAYGHVSGAAVNTDTEEHIYVDITYDYYMN